VGDEHIVMETLDPARGRSRETVRCGRRGGQGRKELPGDPGSIWSVGG
jgi:hypothetical protein